MEGYKKLIFVALFMAMSIGSEHMLADGQFTFSICRMGKEGLKECLPSVSTQNPLPPSRACCSALSNSDLQCFCHFKGSPLLSAYGVDPDLAMHLPIKCGLVSSSLNC